MWTQPKSAAAQPSSPLLVITVITVSSGTSSGRWSRVLLPSSPAHLHNARTHAVIHQADTVTMIRVCCTAECSAHPSSQRSYIKLEHVLWSTWSPVSRVLMSHATARCETRCNLTFFMSVPGIFSYIWSPLHYWLCSDFIWLFILHRNSLMQGEGICWPRHLLVVSPYLMRKVDRGCLLHALLMINLYNLSYVSLA